MDLRLPELGEGILDAIVVNVPIKPGQSVQAGDTILEVETDKSSLPVPASVAGTIGEVRVKVGEKVKIGTVIATLTGGAAPAAPKSAPAAQTPPAKPTAPAAPVATVTQSKRDFLLPNMGEGIESGTIVAVSVKAGDSVKEGQEVLSVETDKASLPIVVDTAAKVEEVLVKVGQKVVVGSKLLVLSGTTAAATTTAPKAASTAPVAEAPKSPIAAVAATTGVVHGNGLVPAGPATRHYARDHAVNLAEVPGTARGGRVTVEDVKQFIRTRVAEPAAAKSGGSGLVVPPMPDFSKYGPIEKKPLSNIRKKIAENLTIAWNTAPAVTQFDLADITDLEAGRKRITENLPKGSPKVTMTVLAIKAVVAALKEFPNFNASIDLARGEAIYKSYYHVGIAVDTERGLVVPVIRDADKKSIRDLAAEVAALADKARAGKLAVDEMRGGSFTITNLGGIGGTAFTPIINYPEVAILGLSRSSIQPSYRDGQFVPRLMMPLSLTYDHRMIDGADGARFTTRLVQLFSDPIRLLMES